MEHRISALYDRAVETIVFSANRVSLAVTNKNIILLSKKMFVLLKKKKLASSLCRHLTYTDRGKWKYGSVLRYSNQIVKL